MGVWLHSQGMVSYVQGKNTFKNCFGTEISVLCSEFRGSRFSKVVKVLIVWYFQSVPEVLSTLESVSAFGDSTVYGFNVVWCVH